MRNDSSACVRSTSPADGLRKCRQVPTIIRKVARTPSNPDGIEPNDARKAAIPRERTPNIMLYQRSIRAVRIVQLFPLKSGRAGNRLFRVGDLIRIAVFKRTDVA